MKEKSRFYRRSVELDEKCSGGSPVLKTKKGGRCVKHVKKDSPGYNPYAVCTVALGGAKEEGLIRFDPKSRKISLTERGALTLRRRYSRPMTSPLWQAIELANEALQEAPPLFRLREHEALDDLELLLEFVLDEGKDKYGRDLRCANSNPTAPPHSGWDEKTGQCVFPDEFGYGGDSCPQPDRSMEPTPEDIKRKLGPGDCWYKKVAATRCKKTCKPE